MSETSFKEAFGVLQHNAQLLRSQSEPDQDGLLAIVTASIQAYTVCEGRIEAVEKALEEALKDSGTRRAEPAVSGDEADR